MSELAEIKNDIQVTKTELAEAKKVEDFTRRDRLEALLVEQQKKENILLASQGKFQLLSLLFAQSNPPFSTFVIHLMTNNAWFRFLSASTGHPAPAPTGQFILIAFYSIDITLIVHVCLYIRRRTHTRADRVVSW